MKMVWETTLTIVGIDYSITCPCVCVSSGNENQIFWLHKEKKYHGIGKVSSNGESFTFRGDPHRDYSTEQERYDNISTWVMAILDGVDETKNMKVFIEGYAFMAAGLVFNIAENCGLLKHYLYKNSIKFSTVPPAVVKKFASKKGNAKKELMYKAFFEKTKVNLVNLYGSIKQKKLGSPITDIVDAYYIAQYGRTQIEQVIGKP